MLKYDLVYFLLLYQKLSELTRKLQVIGTDLSPIQEEMYEKLFHIPTIHIPLSNTKQGPKQRQIPHRRCLG